MKQSNSEEDGWQRFLALCSEAKSPDALHTLLTLFLTIEERKDIADRLLIVSDLLEGKRTQRAIAANRQVSIAKITRGSNSLKMIGETLRRFLTQHIK